MKILHVLLFILGVCDVDAGVLFVNSGTNQLYVNMAVGADTNFMYTACVIAPGQHFTFDLGQSFCSNSVVLVLQPEGGSAFMHVSDGDAISCDFLNDFYHDANFVAKSENESDYLSAAWQGFVYGCPCAGFAFIILGIRTAIRGHWSFKI